MPAETCYHVMELLSDPLGPEWEASRQIIEHENRENWSRACGPASLRAGDLRPKISAKQKRPIAVKNRPLDLPHLFNASRLDVQIPAELPTTSSANATSSNAAQEHSPEVSTPIPTVDNPHCSSTAPSTPETADNIPRPVLREATARRGSLSEAERKEDTSPKARHFSATQ